MHLFRLIPPLDYPAASGYFGVVLRRFGMLLTVPVGVALVAGDPVAAARLGFATVFTVIVGGLMAGSRPPELGHREALVITALIYPAGSLIASVGFWGGHSLVDAWFEAMSGLTTTGLTVLESPELDYPQRFLRSYLQWIGGAGIIVATIAILGNIGGSTHRLFASERGPSGIRGNVAAAARSVVRLYTGTSLVLLIAFSITSGAPDEAVLLTLSTISTGGFAAGATSPAEAGLPVLVVVVAGMLLGATAHTLIRRPGLVRTDWQVRGFVVAAAGGVMLFLFGGEGSPEGFFDAVSAVTTTGFSVSDAAGWSSRLQFSAILLMMVGGMAGSTAGGIKIYRVVLAARLIQTAVLRRVLPREAVIQLRYEGESVPDGEARDVGVFLLAFGAALVAGTLVLTLSGLEVGDAVFGSTSALGTVGLWTATPIAGLSTLPKLALMAMMWAGRLELMAVLVVLYPGTWRRHGRRPSES